MIITKVASSACRARRVERVELCSSTSSTQPKCMGSTRRMCRVEPSGIWAIHGGPKLAQSFLCPTTSSCIGQFSNFFYCHNQEKICNNTITKDPSTPQMCRYTTLSDGSVLKSNDWKRDYFCNNTFYEINYRKQRVFLSQLLSKVTRILQFLHYMFNVSVLLLAYALLKCVVTEVVLFSFIAF